ncbi:MAG TPA: hypothetical protein VMW46_13340 [Candidatus Desulfaltia sp.]|nr:hypothetical protein [Candidatus Desulfaltia sp.]
MLLLTGHRNILNKCQPQKIGPSPFSRAIIKPLDAEKYGVRVADYFLARAA